MMLHIADVLNAEQLAAIDAAFDSQPFVDGATTAGWHAKLVKSNQQMQRTEVSKQMDTAICRTLMSHPVFQMAVRPKILSPLLFSTYGDGAHYGLHVDDAVMRAGLRADVSFTIFLSDPDSYDGGALSIAGPFGAHTLRMPRGSMVLYPSSSLHEVTPVTRGVRRAAVGWAQSLVRDPAQREVLFDLDSAKRDVFDREGKTPTFDALARSSANLLRMWAEI